MDRLRTATWLGIGALGAAGVLFRGSAVGPLIGICLLLALTALAISGRTARAPALRVLLFGALALRLGIITADVHLDLFPKVDAVWYHLRAATLADAWWSGESWQHFDNLKTASYEILIAPLYFWFGPSSLLARTANAIIGAASVYMVFRIGETVFDRRAGLAAGALFALTPSIARMQGENLREALIVLLLTTAVYALISDRLNPGLRWPMFLGAMGWLFFARRATFVVLLVPIAALALHALWDRAREARERRALSRIALHVGVVGAVLVGGLVLTLGVSGDNPIYGTFVTPEKLTDVRGDWAVGGSGYLTDVTFSTWWDVIAFLPVGALYFLFTPFPWQIHNALSLLALAENVLILYPAALLAIGAAAYRRRRRDLRALVGYLVIGAMLYGLIEGNVGTALRHRAQFTWVLFVLAGPAISRFFHDLTTSHPARIHADTPGSPDPPR